MSDSSRSRSAPRAVTPAHRPGRSGGASPASIRCPQPGEVRAASWRWCRRSRPARPGTRSPSTAAGGGHPVVVVGGEHARRAAGAAGSPARPSVSVTSPPSAFSSRGQGGQPVGLVAAQVGDPAQVGRRVGQGGQRGHHRGELAGRVQVGVDAVELAGAADGQAVAVQARPRRPSGRAGRAGASPAWVVYCGQPGTVTRPPVTAAAARKGAAFDRSGSTWTSRRADRAGLDPPDSPARGRRPPRRRRAAPRPSSRRAARSGSAARRAATVSPFVEPGAGQQQRGDELAGRRGVDPHRAAAHPAGAAHGERQPRRVPPSSIRRRRGRAAAAQDRGHRALAGPRVAVEPDVARRPARPPAAGSASRCRPARSRPSAGPRSGAGGDQPVVAERRRARDVVDLHARAPRSAAAISRVSRERSGARSRDGSSASAASTR